MITILPWVSVLARRPGSSKDAGTKGESIENPDDADDGEWDDWGEEGGESEDEVEDDPVLDCSNGPGKLADDPMVGNKSTGDDSVVDKLEDATAPVENSPKDHIWNDWHRMIQFYQKSFNVATIPKTNIETSSPSSFLPGCFCACVYCAHCC